MMVTRLLVIRWIFLLWIVAASRGDSIGGMPVDAKLQAILDAGKALGKKPVELQTPAEARADRAEMVAQFVPMPEYAGGRVWGRGVRGGGRGIAVWGFRPAGG